jgi:hypothetical protein
MFVSVKQGKLASGPRPPKPHYETPFFLPRKKTGLPVEISGRPVSVFP